MATNQDFVITIRAEVEKQISKVFGDIEKRVKTLESSFEKIKKGEIAFDKTARAATGLSKSIKQVDGSLNNLIRAQLKVKDAQIRFNNELRIARTIAEKFGQTVSFINPKLIRAAQNLQLSKDRLSQVGKAYKSAQVRGKGFLNSLLLQQKGVLDFSKRLDVAIQKIITYRIAFGAFRKASEAIQDAFREVISLDNAFGDLQKVMRTNVDTLDLLRRTAFQLGKEFGRSADEVVKGFKIFAQQGLTTEGIIERTRTLLLAISATTLTTAAAIEALTAAANIFGDEFEDLTVIIDKWLAVERTVPVQAKDFADALKGLGFIAKELGITLDELNGIVAAVSTGTRKTGKAIANSFRTIFARATGKEAIEAFQNLGVAIFDLSGDFRPFGDVIRDLGGQWDRLTQRQRINIAQVLGMKRRYTDFLALMNNYDLFLKSTTISQNALNDAQIAAQVEVQKLSRRLESVNTLFSEFKVAVGDELVLNIVEFAESLRESLNNLTSNADEIVKLIKFTLKFAGVLLGVTLGLRLMGRALSFIKAKSLFDLALGIGAVGAVSQRTAQTILFLRGVVLPFVGVVLLLASAFSIWRLSTEKNIDTQEVLNNLLKDQKRRLEDLGRQAALAADKINDTTENILEFEKALQLSKIKGNLAAVRTEIEKIEGELEKTEKSREISFTVKDPFELTKMDRFMEAIKQAEKETGLRFEGILSSEAQRAALVVKMREIFTKEIKELGRELKLFEAQEIQILGIIDDIGGKDVDVLIRVAFKLQQIKNAEEIIKEARDDLIAQKDLKEIILKEIDIPKLEIKIPEVDFSKIDVKGQEELRTTLLKEFDVILDSLSKERVAVIELGVTSEVDNKGLAIQISLFNKVQKSVIELEFGVSNLSKTISNNVKVAALFGDSFDAARLRLKVFKNVIVSLQDEIFDLSSELKVIEEQLDRIGPGKIIDIDELRILEKRKKIIGEILNGTKEDIGLKNLLIQKQVELNKKIQQTRKQLEFNQQIELTTQVIIAKQNAEFDIQIQLLKLVSSALTGTSRSRLLNQKILEKQLTFETDILDLQEKKEKLAVQEQINGERLLGFAAEKNKLRNLENKLILIGIKFDAKRQQQTLRLLENLTRESSAIQSSVAGVISAGLADLPKSMAQRTQAEEELAKRRKELEAELSAARRAGDQAAINDALRGLSELAEEARRLGSFIGDIFNTIASVADIRFKKLIESLTNELLNLQLGEFTIGQRIANEISQGGTTAANLMLQAFLDGGLTAAEAIRLSFPGADGIAPSTDSTIEKASKDLNKAAIELGKQFSPLVGNIVSGMVNAGVDVSNLLENGVTSGSRKGSILLRAGILAGAQVLGQIIGGGGLGAGRGAGIGGLAGGIAASLFGATPGGAAALGIAAVGSIIGGLIGGRSDRIDNEAFITLTDAVNRNSLAVENNNKILELERSLINVPSRFIPPPLQGSFLGGINGNLTVQVFTDSGSSPQAIGQAVVDEIDNAFSSTVRRSRSSAPSF